MEASRPPTAASTAFKLPGKFRTSRVLTLYTGLRLNDHTDFLFDLENTNGQDLSGIWI